MRAETNAATFDTDSRCFKLKRTKGPGIRPCLIRAGAELVVGRLRMRVSRGTPFGSAITVVNVDVTLHQARDLPRANRAPL